MTAETRRMPLNPFYEESGIVYIRYTAEIEEKSNGKKKIAGTRPAFSKIEKQPTYTNQAVAICLY